MERRHDARLIRAVSRTMTEGVRAATMTRGRLGLVLAPAGVVTLLTGGSALLAQSPPRIAEAIVGEVNPRTPEISTEELRKVLDEGRATVFDARPFNEFAVSHIPGAKNVAPKAGMSLSMYVSDVAEIGRVMNGNKRQPLVLYCNGPFCGKSGRLADELLSAGYTNVRRYQLGIPVWRALGGVTVIESEGLRHVIANDDTAVVIDVREVQDYRAGTLPRARHLPRSAVTDGKDVGEVRRAKDDGRLPMEDHNTRIVVIGRDAAEARHVAEALTREAFHNVAYYAGSFEDAQAAVRLLNRRPANE